MSLRVLFFGTVMGLFIGCAKPSDEVNVTLNMSGVSGTTYFVFFVRENGSTSFENAVVYPPECVGVTGGLSCFQPTDAACSSQFTSAGKDYQLAVKHSVLPDQSSVELIACAFDGANAMIGAGAGVGTLAEDSAISIDVSSGSPLCNPGIDGFPDLCP